MNPQQLQQFNEMYAWFQQRKVQQISFPLDDASKNGMGVPLITGLGSIALTQVYVDSGGDTVTGPKAYSDTFILVSGGVQYEVPFLQTL